MMNPVQIVKGQRPPNMDYIAARFPAARGPNTIFAYGDKIYIPNGADLSPPLMAHEKVHCERQQFMGVEIWWSRYIEEPDFMYQEEVMAHAAEYLVLIENGTRQVRRGAIKTVSKRLSGALYGKCVTRQQAENDILAHISEKERDNG